MTCLLDRFVSEWLCCHSLDDSDKLLPSSVTVKKLNVRLIYLILLRTAHVLTDKYRVILKFLRDFRPLRYSNRDGHAEGEHVNRGRGTPSFCPTLQVHDISNLGDAEDAKFGNFGKFQGTERFLIPCPRHVSSRLPSSGETCK